MKISSTKFTIIALFLFTGITLIYGCKKEEPLEPNPDMEIYQNEHYAGGDDWGGLGDTTGTGGGGNGGVTVNSNWQSVASIPGPARSAAIAFSLNGKGYVGLGEDYPGMFSDMYSYDPIANSWTQLDSFPGGARRNSIAFVIGNTAYVGLGYGRGPSGGSFGELRDLYKYDESLDAWTSVSSFTGWGADAASVFVINNKAYVLTSSYTVFEYDPASDAWTEMGNFPGESREFAVSFAIGGEGYVATGYDDGGLGSLGDCWKYNATSDNWTKLDTFPGNPRNQAVGFELDGYGVLVGGSGSISADNEVWVYNKQNDSWGRADKNYPEMGVSLGVGFVINNSAYVGTGWVPDGFLGDVSAKFHKLTIN